MPCKGLHPFIVTSPLKAGNSLDSSQGEVLLAPNIALKPEVSRSAGVLVTGRVGGRKAPNSVRKEFRILVLRFHFGHDLVNNPPPTIQIDTGCDKPNLSDRVNKILICIAAAERSLCFEALVQGNRRQLVRHVRHPQLKRLLLYTHNPT